VVRPKLHEEPLRLATLAAEDPAVPRWVILDFRFFLSGLY
jgi:hypothetical protein